jgi:hypothetical protein
MGATLEKYKNMFSGFIDSAAQTYHVFLKDAQGQIQGYYETFEAQPEVWQAMLGELQGIDSNTAKMLEAEYFIPSWYATPSRYWAMKETGTKEFGPAQTGLWEIWQEFLAKHNDEIKNGVPILTNAINANNQYSSTITDNANAVNDAATIISDATIKIRNSAGQLVDIPKELMFKVTTPEEMAPYGINFTPVGAAPQTSYIQGELDKIWNLISSPFNWFKRLLGFQYGGVIPQTGPYYMHKSEVVTPAADFRQTNNILNSSYQTLLISQEYLSNINLGILGVRQEIALLRADLASQPTAADTSFNRVVRSGYSSIGSITGVRK